MTTSSTDSASNVVNAAARFRKTPTAFVDPALKILASLPTTVGLATRVRRLIEHNALDVTVDAYIAAWIESAAAGD